MFPGSDSSPEDSTLAAAGTQAVVVKKTKPRGHKPSPQDSDKGIAKGQTDSKIQLRKKPTKTRPCDGKFYWLYTRTYILVGTTTDRQWATHKH